MSVLNALNRALSVIFFLCYFYQLVYLIIPLIKRDRPHLPEVLHRYAVLIAARNEEAVIGNLIESIKAQDYPEELVSVFVVADNCDDGTVDACDGRKSTVEVFSFVSRNIHRYMRPAFLRSSSPSKRTRPSLPFLRSSMTARSPRS